MPRFLRKAFLGSALGLRIVLLAVLSILAFNPTPGHGQSDPAMVRYEKTFTSLSEADPLAANFKSHPNATFGMSTGGVHNDNVSGRSSGGSASDVVKILMEQGRTDHFEDDTDESIDKGDAFRSFDTSERSLRPKSKSRPEFMKTKEIPFVTVAAESNPSLHRIAAMNGLKRPNGGREREISVGQCSWEAEDGAEFDWNSLPTDPLGAITSSSNTEIFPDNPIGKAAPAPTGSRQVVEDLEIDPGIGGRVASWTESRVPTAHKARRGSGSQEVGDAANAGRSHIQDTTLVSTIGQTRGGNATVGRLQDLTLAYAQQFTTGTDEDGYTISEVVAKLEDVGGDSSPRVSIYSDSSESRSGSQPGTILYALTNPSSPTNGSNTFTASADATLAKETKYWVVFGNSSTGTTAADRYAVARTIPYNGSEDEGGVSGWSIANSYRYKTDADGEWGRHLTVFLITIRGRIIGSGSSMDATLRDLALEDEDGNSVSLSPSFASQTASYATSVGGDTDNITVGPTLSDSGASYVIKLDGVTDSDGTVSLTVGSNVITVEVTAQDNQTTRTYTVTVTRSAPLSSDATLSALALSGVDFGTFESSRASYTATVANSVTQTTVTPEVNDSGASYLIKLDGVTDSDGTVSLAVGSNVITVEVTAQDRQTARTYTVTVTRAAPPSTDATLGALTLSGVNFGTFRSGTTSYTATVGNSRTQTTVSPTVNHSGASYVIKLDGVTDSDGIVSLAVGRNVITVRVTAQDGQTTRTYILTLTRSAALSSDATLSALALSGVDFGTLDSSTVSYTATVANSVSETTVAPIVNNSNASYVIKLGGEIDADGTVSLTVGINIITVEVTAQDGQTTRTYTVTVTRASENEQPPRSDAPVTGELPTDDPRVNFRVSSYTHDRVEIAWSVPRSRDITGYVVQRYYHDGSEFISSGSVEGSRFTGTTTGGDSHSLGNTNVEADTLYQYVLSLNDDSGATIIESSTTVRTLSSDATLSGLTLSGVTFGTFDSETTSYTTVVVAYDVSETTATPTLNHSGAGYVVELDGEEDADGVIDLAVGENVITVVVTAEDGETTLTYSVSITRREHSLLTGELASDDPPVNFRVTGYDEGEVTLAWEIPDNRSITSYVLDRYDHDGTEFASSDLSVSGSVAGGSSVTESDTGLTSDTLYRYHLALKSDEGAVIIEKSLELRMLADGATALSSDATLSALSLSGVELDPAFTSATHRYTASVASDVAQTTVTATANHTAVSYVVKIGGAVDADGVLDLTPGRNVITVHVTAEDGVTTRIYTVVVSRAKAEDALSADATLRSLSLSGVDFGGYDPDTTSYTADVTNDVTQTTVTPVRYDVEAAHVIRLGGLQDTDGVIDLAVGANVITVVVTAEDGETALTYTVTVTREGTTASAPGPDPVPAPADTCVQPVGPDGAIPGSWDDTCLSENNAPGGAGDRYARFYTFTLTEATDIVISLSSDEDTYLYLLDGHGKGGDTLHQNDDIAGGGANLNSRLSVILQPGSYTIEATTYSPETSGNFTLTIAGLRQAGATAPQPEPDPEPEADVCVESADGDVTIVSSWDDSCLSDRAALSGTGNRYARFYTFSLDEAADVTVTLTSDEDTYLYLLSGHGRNGTALFEEDDINYPSNTNSRLTETLQAGDYTIEATTYYAQTDGDFSLTISGLSSSP